MIARLYCVAYYDERDMVAPDYVLDLEAAESYAQTLKDAGYHDVHVRSVDKDVEILPLFIELDEPIVKRKRSKKK